LRRQRVAILAFCRDPMTTVWIYVDTKKEVGDVDHLKVFATQALTRTRALSTPTQQGQYTKESVDHNCDSSFEYAPPSRPCQIPPESRQFWDLTAAFLLRICNALAESIQYLSRESRSTLAVELGLKAKGK